MRKTLIMLVAVVALAGLASAQDNTAPVAPAAPTAPATGGTTPTPAPGNGGGKWDKNHPRRAEVNGRLDRSVDKGTMTKGQAAADHREERRMAKKDGGHITKADQHKLNKRIDKQKARDRKDHK
jgi:opacity protein-like surface antigen